MRRARSGRGAIQVNGFTDPSTMQAAVRGAEQFFVNDQMTWLARTTGEELPVCAFDVDDLPEPIGFLIWSDDPSPHSETLGRPRAVLWCRAGMALRVLVLDDAGPFRREIERLGSRADPAWKRQVTSGMAGDLSIGFGAEIPLNTETSWDAVKHSWSVDKYGRPARDLYGRGAEGIAVIHEDQLRILRTLLGTLLLIRQPADARRALWQADQVRPDAAARKRLRRAGADHPDALVRYITLRQSVRPLSDDDRGAQDTAGRVYRHQWFVRPHRRRYPDQDHPSGYSRKWVGPYLVTPAGCEDAPILGRDRVVNVLRR
ncbi:hypothetical protein GT034_16755 [Streptomyces sp. SID2563]|uniref:hypothetical protein n=1 Tax=Streptomyces sp. SID2563 TaxID=2690255 RepID=UPI00136CBD9E|nr:hypothetical protein [Streptomyces sp. SID2563]MYW09989.1 hypothetical protein [Streptomyces sp. SID2563]